MFLASFLPFSAPAVKAAAISPFFHFPLHNLLHSNIARQIPQPSLILLRFLQMKMHAMQQKVKITAQNLLWTLCVRFDQKLRRKKEAAAICSSRLCSVWKVPSKVPQMQDPSADTVHTARCGSSSGYAVRDVLSMKPLSFLCCVRFFYAVFALFSSISTLSVKRTFAIRFATCS